MSSGAEAVMPEHHSPLCLENSNSQLLSCTSSRPDNSSGSRRLTSSDPGSTPPHCLSGGSSMQYEPAHHPAHQLRSSSASTASSSAPHLLDSSAAQLLIPTAPRSITSSGRATCPSLSLRARACGFSALHPPSIKILLFFLTIQLRCASSIPNSDPTVHVNGVPINGANPDFRCVGFTPPSASQQEQGRWRSWRLNATTDKGEVFRLRRCLSEAEEDLARLSEDLIDAKQAQERANLALKSKDTKLNLALDELDRAVSDPEPTEAYVAITELQGRVRRLEQANGLLQEENEELRLQGEEIADKYARLDNEIQERATLLASDMLEDARSHWEAEQVIEMARERKERDEEVSKVREEATQLQTALAQTTTLKEEKEATLEVSVAELTKLKAEKEALVSEKDSAISQLEQQVTVLKIQRNQILLNHTKQQNTTEAKELKRQVQSLQQEIISVQSRSALHSSKIEKVTAQKNEIEAELGVARSQLAEEKLLVQGLQQNFTQNYTEVKERYENQLEEMRAKLQQAIALAPKSPQILGGSPPRTTRTMGGSAPQTPRHLGPSNPQTPRSGSFSTMLMEGERVVSDTSMEDSPTQLLPGSLRDAPLTQSRSTAERMRLFEQPVEYEMLRAEGSRHLAAMNDDIRRLRSELNQLVAPTTPNPAARVCGYGFGCYPKRKTFGPEPPILNLNQIGEHTCVRLELQQWRGPISQGPQQPSPYQQNSYQAQKPSMYQNGLPRHSVHAGPYMTAHGVSYGPGTQGVPAVGAECQGLGSPRPSNLQAIKPRSWSDWILACFGF